MRIELTILGLLMKGNLYGYDIKKKINEASGGFVDTKFGSIYYAIKKSQNKGWIKKKGTEKDGGNPERYVYQITPEGKKYFTKGITRYFEKSFIHFDVDLLLMFLLTLDKNAKEQFVEERLEHLNEKLKDIKKKIAEIEKSKEDISLYSYIESHLKAELAWVKSMKL